MEKISHSIKLFFTKIKTFFTSTAFLKKYDKTMKILKKVIPMIVVYALLICFSYVFMYPILKMVVDSFKSESDLMNPDIVWLPRNLTLSNYKNAAAAMFVFRPIYTFAGAKSGLYGIQSTLWNSALYSFLTACCQTLNAGLAGYAFARFNFRWKKFWFAGLIISFVVPIQILVLPRKIMMNPIINFFSTPAKIFGLTGSSMESFINANLNILQTTPMIIVSILGQGVNSAILVFIFFSFFKMIPSALDEAAQIDGANYRQIFYHVIIKMSVPTILVVFLFSFVWNWNDTFVIGQMTLLTGDKKEAFLSMPSALGTFNYVISQGTATSGTDSEGNNRGWRAAAMVISILPLVILYAFTQRKFVEGIENTGVTGI